MLGIYLVCNSSRHISGICRAYARYNFPGDSRCVLAP
jgi:hypothetical protein